MTDQIIADDKTEKYIDEAMKAGLLAVKDRTKISAFQDVIAHLRKKRSFFSRQFQELASAVEKDFPEFLDQ